MSQLVPPSDLSISVVRKVLPKRLFERSALRGLSYLLRDLVGVAITMYIGLNIDSLVPWMLLRVLLAWPLYWFIQGCWFTALWVIAHECGHRAFSEHAWIDHSIGFAVHSALLVPYFSWAHSHGLHHSNANSMQRDTVFVPIHDRSHESSSAISRAFGLFRMVTIGWWAYLLMDTSGPLNHRNQGWVSHFNPFCVIFINRDQRLGCVISMIGIALMIFCLIVIASEEQWGWSSVLFHYVIPYLVCNFWLVTITFLQHSHPKIPRYYDSEWSWERGALGTVDRDFGLIGRMFHHITDSHVIHHLCSRIPFYHAKEATVILRESGVLGEYYLCDDTHWLLALWHCYRDAWTVPKEKNCHPKGIAFFHPALKQQSKDHFA